MRVIEVNTPQGIGGGGGKEVGEGLVVFCRLCLKQQNIAYAEAEEMMRTHPRERGEGRKWAEGGIRGVLQVT